jgi:hypothetical protein
VSPSEGRADSSGTATFVASRFEHLDRLRRERRPAGRINVELDLPGLEDERRKEFERRMARYLTACGCGEGTVAGTPYLFVVPILVLMGVLSAGSVGAWIVLLLGFVADLLLGKIAGLAIARLRLLLTVNELERLFREPSVRR